MAMIAEHRALALWSLGAATKAECGASANDDPGSNRPAPPISPDTNKLMEHTYERIFSCSKC